VLNQMPFAQGEEAADQVQIKPEPVEEDLIELAGTNDAFYCWCHDNDFAFAQSARLGRAQPVCGTRPDAQKAPGGGFIDPFLSRNKSYLLDA